MKKFFLCAVLGMFLVLFACSGDSEKTQDPEQPPVVAQPNATTPSPKAPPYKDNAFDLSPNKDLEPKGILINAAYLPPKRGDGGEALVSLFITFSKDYNGVLELRLLDTDGNQYASSAKEIVNAKAGQSGPVDFRFPAATDLKDISSLKLEAGGG